MLKGYQGWAGRALTALEALARCAELLHDYEIVVYGASPSVVPAVRHFRRSHGVDISIQPRSPHRVILGLFGRARLALGVNATDGVPNSMLEAMVMGAFPIQSDTESTSEWLTDGVTGLLVDPDEPSQIEAAIRRALKDDALVDVAAERNLDAISRKLDLSVVKPKVIEMYTSIAATHGREVR